MIATLATLVVRIQGDITSLVESAKKTEGILDKLDKGVNGIGASFKRAGEIAGGFLAANVIAGAGARITSFVSDSVNAAKDLGESVNAVNVIFGESSQEVLDWGKNNATQFGLSQRAFNQLATPLGAMLKNAGLDLTIVSGKTIDLTKRAADMASVFNTDVSEALEAIQAGLRGESDPLERFGVGLSAAKVEARALADTGKTVASSLTDQEKMLARVSLIMEQTNDVAGDFANTSDQLANKQRIQAARTEELQAVIGQKLLPVQLKITEAKLAMVDALVRHVIPAIDGFIKYIQFVLSDGDKLNDWLTHIPEPLRGFAMATADVALFVQRHWGTIMDVVQFAYDFIKTKVEGMIQVISAVAEIVSSVVNLVSALVHGDWSRAWTEMKDIAQASVSLLEGWLKWTLGNLPSLVWDLASELARAGYNAGRDLADSIVNGIGNLAGRVADKLSIAGVSLGDVISVGGGALDKIGLRAAGGPVRAGMPYIVGERRPELFVPSQNGYIMPSVPQTGAGGGNITVYVSGSILTDRDITRIVRDAALRQEFRGVLQSA